VTSPSRKERLQIGRAETDRRLKLQLAIFSAVFAVVTALVLIRIVRDGIDPFWPLAGFAVGLLIGVILARSRSLGWDTADHEVVSSMSAFGIIVTVAYLAFTVLLRDRLLTDVVSDVDTASVAGLAITAGVMLGRTLVTLRTIRRMLTSAGEFDHHQHSRD
jgi:hypothetical protein